MSGGVFPALPLNSSRKIRSSLILLDFS